MAAARADIMGRLVSCERRDVADRATWYEDEHLVAAGVATSAGHLARVRALTSEGEEVVFEGSAALELFACGRAA